MDPYLGEIRLFASNFAPAGWQFCNGQSLSINEYETLYALIGTTYGGDSSTFKLPDLRGLLVCSPGQGTGLSSYTLGQTFGQPGVALTEAQAPHTHSVMATNQPATSTVSTTNLFAVAESPALVYARASVGGITPRTMDSALLTMEGANAMHANLMSSLAVNYIICTQGLFPSQN
jgi:microcystin-dependent protein